MESVNKASPATIVRIFQGAFKGQIAESCNLFDIAELNDSQRDGATAHYENWAILKPNFALMLVTKHKAS